MPWLPFQDVSPACCLLAQNISIEYDEQNFMDDILNTADSRTKPIDDIRRQKLKLWKYHPEPNGKHRDNTINVVLSKLYMNSCPPQYQLSTTAPAVLQN